jgi:hypothetical protein
MISRHPRRLSVMVCGVLLAVAACGGASDQVATPTVPDTPTEPAASNGDEFTEGDSTQDEANGSTAEATHSESTDAGTAEAAATTTPASSEPASTEPPVSEAPPATDAPASGVVGGRQFAATIDPEAVFDGNPFPDLVVDDVGRGTKANISNVLPSDRPVLLWAWAPH